MNNANVEKIISRQDLNVDTRQAIINVRHFKNLTQKPLAVDKFEKERKINYEAISPPPCLPNFGHFVSQTYSY